MGLGDLRPYQQPASVPQQQASSAPATMDEIDELAAQLTGGGKKKKKKKKKSR